MNIFLALGWDLFDWLDICMDESHVAADHGHLEDGGEGEHAGDRGRLWSAVSEFQSVI